MLVAAVLASWQVSSISCMLRQPTNLAGCIKTIRISSIARNGFDLRQVTLTSQCGVPAHFWPACLHRSPPGSIPGRSRILAHSPGDVRTLLISSCIPLRVRGHDEAASLQHMYLQAHARNCGFVSSCKMGRRARNVSAAHQMESRPRANSAVIGRGSALFRCGGRSRGQLHQMNRLRFCFHICGVISWMLCRRDHTCSCRPSSCSVHGHRPATRLVHVKTARQRGCGLSYRQPEYDLQGPLAACRWSPTHGSIESCQGHKLLCINSRNAMLQGDF